MANNNINLQNAKNLKDDEFYTTYECIAEELIHYKRHFRGKCVLCNCDDPLESNFSKYFLKNFNALGLSRLICTSYKDSKVSSSMYKQLGIEASMKGERSAYILDVSFISGGVEIFSDEFINYWLKENKPIRRLKGNGDFQSEECLKYLNQADIIVTNPPFSLFKKMVTLLISAKKQFLLIGNQNALTYKEIFPLIRENLVWTGYHFGDMKFRVPNDSPPRNTRFWVDSTGQKWRSLGNAMWLTNMDIERRHLRLKLSKRFNVMEYPLYDDFEAINVKRVMDIPMDYSGIMGVPITIINKYNPEQFEIIGEANHGSDSEFDLFKPMVNGKLLFKRILIRNKEIGNGN